MSLKTNVVCQIKIAAEHGDIYYAKIRS